MRAALPLRIAYVIDPRFSGGTSAAVAAELRAASRVGQVRVHAARAALFARQPAAPQIEAALAGLDLPLIQDAAMIAADVVLLHNPLFLKQNATLTARITARHLIVVAHENFLRPGGAEAFDAAHCLRLIDRATLALRKSLAPISAHSRAMLAAWLAANPQPGWDVLAEDWFNICDFSLAPPNPRPTDRRGRHSRPGFEKFPGLAEMEMCFPPHARSNVILGADAFLEDGLPHPHWQMLRYRSLAVAEYLQRLDFMVYFTSPLWRESFGRVIAEAIAAGKVVITDPQTAVPFGRGAIGAQPAEVDQIIARLIEAPARYRGHVRAGQARLQEWSAYRFARMFARAALPGTGA